MKLRFGPGSLEYIILESLTSDSAKRRHNLKKVAKFSIANPWG